MSLSSNGEATSNKEVDELQSQKQIVALQWEVNNLRKLSQTEHHEHSKTTSLLEQRIHELEDETTMLKERNGRLEDRHESHTEELMFLQTELFCVQTHLTKLRKQIEEFRTLMVQKKKYKKRRSSKVFSRKGKKLADLRSQLEAKSERLSDRSEFTITVLDTTVTSLEEILSEYNSVVSSVATPPVVEDEDEEEKEGDGKGDDDTNKEETKVDEEEAAAIAAAAAIAGNEGKAPIESTVRSSLKSRRTSRPGMQKRVSIANMEMPQPTTRQEPENNNRRNSDLRSSFSEQKKGNKSSKRLLLKGMSSRRLIKQQQKAELEEEEQRKLVEEMFKTNQMRFAQYQKEQQERLRQSPSASRRELVAKRHSNEYQDSRRSWVVNPASREAELNNIKSELNDLAKFQLEQQTSLDSQEKDLEEREKNLLAASPSASPSSSPEKKGSDKRNQLIESELLELVGEAEKEELEQPFEKDAVDALRSAAGKICYVKMYYDVFKDEFLYFPTLAKTLLDMTLITEAESYYGDEDETFPFEYSAALRSISALKMVDEEDGGIDEDYMERLAIDVELWNCVLCLAWKGGSVPLFFPSCI